MDRRQHSPEEKFRLVPEVLKGDRSINEIAAENNIHPSMPFRWKREAVEGLPSLFENDAARKRKEEKAHGEELQELCAQTGRLSTQNERLRKKSGL